MICEAPVYVQNSQYVLFDSLFNWSNVIKGVKSRGRDVVGILNDIPYINYTYQG